MKNMKLWIVVGAVIAVGVVLGLVLRVMTAQEPAVEPAPAVTAGVIVAPSATPSPESVAEEHTDDEGEHEHDDSSAMGETLSPEQLVALEALVMQTGVELSSEPVEETFEQRTARLEPLFVSTDIADDNPGPMRSMYPNGVVVTLPGVVEFVMVMDGESADSVRYRVSVPFDGSHAAEGSTTAQRHRESAVWDLTVVMDAGTPKVSLAELISP